MFQNRILAEPVTEEEQPISGESRIFTPETVSKTIGKARIVAVDSGKLRVGDLVLYDCRQELPIKLEGKEYLILSENQIIAVLKLNSEQREALDSSTTSCVKETLLSAPGAGITRTSWELIPAKLTDF